MLIKQIVAPNNTIHPKEIIIPNVIMVQISFQNTRDNMKIVIETPNIIAAIIIRSSIKTDVKLIHNEKTRIKSTTLLSKFNEEKKRANPIMKKPMGINKNDIFSNTLSGSIRAYNILYAMTDEAIITRPTRKQIILCFISFSCLKRAFIIFTISPILSILNSIFMFV